MTNVHHDGLEGIQLNELLRNDYHDIPQDEAQFQIDALDAFLSKHPKHLSNDDNDNEGSSTDSYRRALRRLRNLCEWHDLLPQWCLASMEDYPRLESEHPVGRGGYADVFRGTMGPESTQRIVALKRLRLHVYEDKEQVRKLFRREVALWSQLKHPNIIPFVAVFINLPRELSIASIWMKNGDITFYITSNPGVDAQRLVLNVADGLAFMHSLGIVHGDLKGSNVLINEHLEACLSDFGLSSIHHTNTMTPRIDSIISGGSLRWCSPEQLSGGGVAPHVSADVYSFGILLWEILTCRIPYDHLYHDAMVLGKVTLDSLRPCALCILQVPGFGDAPHVKDVLYDLMTECWSNDGSLRPPMDKFFRERIAESKAIPVTHTTLEGQPRLLTILQPYLGLVATALVSFQVPEYLIYLLPTTFLLIAGAVRNALSMRFHLVSFHLRLHWPLEISYLVRGTPHLVLMFNSFWAAVSLLFLFMDALILLIRAFLPKLDVSWMKANLFFLVGVEVVMVWYLDVCYWVLLGRRWWSRKGKAGRDGVVVLDRRVYVTRLPFEATEDSVREVFVTAGAIEWVSVHGDLGHAVVEYMDEEGAETALRSFQEYVMEGKRIQVAKCPVISWDSSTNRTEGL